MLTRAGMRRVWILQSDGYLGTHSIDKESEHAGLS